MSDDFDRNEIEEFLPRCVATLKAAKQREQDFQQHPSYQLYLDKAKQRGRLPVAIPTILDQDAKLAQTTFLQPSFISSKLR